ncbi:MAG: response regulator [Rhodospirillales bacterium]|nr:response regulator [Rhodospirillales bacterium]
MVDDEPAVLEIVAEFLEDIGYRVRRAASGADALAQLDADPAIALMLTDISMPVMSGTELAGRAAISHPELKIVLMSGYADPTRVEGRVLRKPFTIRALAETLASALADGVS